METPNAIQRKARIESGLDARDHFAARFMLEIRMPSLNQPEDASMFAGILLDATCKVKVEYDSDFELPEDELLPDYRARLTPSEVVQSKLLSLMPGMAIPVSSMHFVRKTR